MRSKSVMVVLTVLTLLSSTAATTTITSNMALADIPQKLVEEKFCVSCDAISHVFSFQQQPRYATGSAFAGGLPATMGYADKKGSDSSSSANPSLSTTSTANVPHRKTSSPSASRANIDNPDASAHTTVTKRNVGTPTSIVPSTTSMSQQVTIKNWPSFTQQQQQDQRVLVASQNPVRPLVGLIACKSTEPLENGDCIPQSPTCVLVNASQNGNCRPLPSCYRHGSLCN
ncbi:MAG: hypothetical protein WCC17_16145 [Candidatus Nitrosopolaris sp.]